MDLNRQVQKAFLRLNNLYQLDLPSQELKAKLLSELDAALHELQTTGVELLEQNEELAANRNILEEERCRYQELFDFAPDGYLVTDTEGIIRDANIAATNLFKVSRAFLIGKPLAMFVRSEEQLFFRTRLAAIKASPDTQNENWELDMFSEKRSTFPVSITVGKVIPSRGEKTELRWLLRDNTERKRIDLAISRLDRLNLIGEMAASIGHEIRNPMTAVRGFLQMLSLKNEYAKDLTFFNLMIEELDRANEIISEYLNMAKDKMVDLQPQCLDEIIKSIYPLIQADANLQNMTVRLELGTPPRPFIDAKEIRQMILNMARNGLEAMSPGGTLIIGTTVQNSEIMLCINDEGKGVDSNIRDKLGTPFLTTKDTGIGLGLSVCYSIAARHNARIDLETGPGGTTFKVCFPMPVEQRFPS